MTYFIKGETIEIAELFKKQFPDKIESKIKESDLVCEHIFDLLGSGPKKLSGEGEGYQDIDWHSDFKSGFKWNHKTFFRNIRFGDKEGVDVIVPWELSRFQHLIFLGQAYILNRDEKYAQEFVSQVGDWIRYNPIGFGVNWFSTMDVAIRAANWLVALEYFSGSSTITIEFLEKFYTSVYEHGAFIRYYLKTRPVRNNHYLANIAGLFFISIYCPFFKESKKWQSFAVKELEKEMLHQVYPDGCDFEASTSYHRLALEMFFYCDLLAKRNGTVFSFKYQQRLRKMFEFLLYSVKPNGRIPQIGDNDNGRFLVFCKRPVLEHKYLLSIAAVYYKDSEFNLSEFGFDEETFWVFGKEGVEIFQSLSLRKWPLASKAFADAGWYIVRHGNDYCFISCGPNGQDGRGGHAHNDKLSFELMLNGEDIIVDPGTYAYTSYPVQRNRFRSTEYHNAIKFNNYEQNEFCKKNIFSLPDLVKIEFADLRETDGEVTFEGEIRYAGITHKRIVMLDKFSKNWLFKDTVSCKDPLSRELIFHLSPYVTFENGCFLSKRTGGKIASINTEGYELENREYDYSPAYGKRTKAKVLSVNSGNCMESKTISTFIKLA
ncbi:MAG: alginate lyase family protein [Candidatus Omnitrophica bacterium]|nr:alginate lyase family protein [Candidatus Omnitrophota bacterium]